MKTIKQLLAFCTLALATSLSQADDLGISVVLEGEIQPGVYGRVELGKDSHPDLVYREPRLIHVDERYSSYRPVYLHVPPGHAKHWDKHCHKYNACYRKVYFVRSVEYDEGHNHQHKHEQHQHKQRPSQNGKGNGKGNGDKGKGKDKH